MAKYDKFTSPKNPNRPVQVESAVRDGSGKNIENNYAKQNGSYSTLTAGLAEGIATNRQIEDPELACPPITMGTTGGDAEIQTGNNPFENLEGNSKVWNQIIPTISVNATQNGITIYSNNDGKFVVTVNNATNYNQVNLLSGTFKQVNGHKYLFAGQDKDNGIQVYPSSYSGTGTTYIYTAQSNTAISVYFYVAQTTPNGTYTLYPMIIDLTAIYGAGNEPSTVAEFKKDFGAKYYAYNAGTILSAKSASLISRARQQWDEQWEAGTIKLADGENQSSSTDWRSKNYIPVVPNTTYHFHNGGTLTQIVIYFYDENKNYIAGLMASAYNKKEFEFDTIANGLGAKYIKFVLYQASTHYGTTYNNDITISVFWADGEGYDQYYPYEAQVVELPNLELRSAGTAKDIAYNTGGGKRRIGMVDLGTLTYTLSASGLFQVNLWEVGAQPPVDSTVKGNILASPYETIISNDIQGPNGNHPSPDKVMALSPSYNLYINDLSYNDPAAFKTAMSGVYLFFELKEETDISASENPGWTQLVKTDNYGTLQFTTDPAQIPQVEQPYFIKYTISLTEFLDSAYVRADGAAENLALQKDVDEIVSGAKQVGNAEFADNLTPYDEDSGTEQDEPFINQATGTANGTLSDFASTSIAQLKEKRGNSVVVNQLINLVDKSSTSWAGGTYSISNGVISITVDATESTVSAGILNLGFYGLANHKYLVLAYGSNMEKLFLYDNVTATFVNLNNIKLLTVNSGNTFRLNYYSQGVAEAETITIKGLYVIDLTQMFGNNNNIPEDLTVNTFFRYYQGSLAYTPNPQIVDSNAQVLKTIGRNLLDKSTFTKGRLSNGEVADASGTTAMTITETGVSFTTNAAWRGVNSDFIKIIPNQFYYFYTVWVDSLVGYIDWYDANKNWIEGATNTQYGGATPYRQAPANACYARISFQVQAAGTYNVAGITFSQYFEGESGYDKYYPYEVLTETDTGNEVLRSAGNARDYKEPNGTIHRLVGRVDLGDLDWTYEAGNVRFYCHLTASHNAKKASASNVKANLLCARYINVDSSTASNNSTDMCIAFDNSTIPFVIIHDSHYTDPTALKTALTGVYLYYELAESTEEEGTPFAENMKINDFGSMQWDAEDFNGIPMANLIFYPSDYKAFIDTLYDYTEGAPSNLVLQSERTADKAAQASTDSALQVAVGGTLRQLLSSIESVDFLNTKYIDLGNLDWGYDAPNKVFYVLVSDKKLGMAKILTTLFKNIPDSIQLTTMHATYGDMRIGQNSNNQYIYATYDAIDNAVTFKNSLKGVLLAYEKAE